MLNNCPTLSVEDKVRLQENFTEEEVLRCLKLCAGDKAPGPDGFSMGFEIVKLDIMMPFITSMSRKFLKEASLQHS